ncbi:MAG: tetraacyldisaccharide 4'-kinase [Chitinivibrionales bacterium]
MHPHGKGILLTPFSALYGCVVRARNFMYDRIPDLSRYSGKPTISIGGIHAGGIGKTPMALLVGRYLHAQGREVAFLSRGYKRKYPKPVISVPFSNDSWETVGDEPALLHTALPESWLGVGASRCRSARLLSPRLGAKAIFILDDAFQHRRIQRDLDIVCLPADPFNDALLPAGTLREPLSGLTRARSICLIGAKNDASLLAASQEKLKARFRRVPVFVLYQEPICWVHLDSGACSQNLPLKRPVVLCGIARPERFIFLIKKMGISTVAESIFIDHHPFTVNDIDSIVRRTNTTGIITTEKDAFRLRSLKLVNHAEIWYLKIDLQFSDRESRKLFYAIIDTIIP